MPLATWLQNLDWAAGTPTITYYPSRMINPRVRPASSLNASSVYPSSGLSASRVRPSSASGLNIRPSKLNSGSVKPGSQLNNPDLLAGE